MGKKKENLEINCTVENVVEAMTDLVADKAPGDYFVFAPSVGIIRARRSEKQTSWQFFGVGTTKANLKRLLEEAPRAEEEFCLPVHVGAYNVDLIETLLKERRAAKAGDVSAPDLPEEEETGKKKKKKKDKAQDEQTENDAPKTKKTNKVDLDAPHHYKAVKAALKNCGLWDKKTRKKLFAAINFADETASLNEIIGDFEEMTGDTLTAETINILAANL